MLLYKYILASILFLASLSVLAQEQDRVQRCGTDEMMARMMAEDPELENAFHEYLQSIDSLSKQEYGKKSTVAVFKIPVVFHVVYNTEFDNISKAQILDGLRVLNEDFRRLNADTNLTRNQFKPDAADVEIEFVLATKDPNGNCTTGITRRQDFRSVNATNGIKSPQWDPSKYLNIWVVNSISQSISNNVLGYAQFPNGPSSSDGVVIRHDALGAIGTSANAGRVGRTLPHELGHSFGLPHPFGSSPYSCSKDDGIGDTPPVNGPSYGCDLNRATCGNTNQIENFMDYADDECVNMFTNGQRNVMRNVANSIRFFLKSPGNLINTGVTNPAVCTPIAALNMESPALCPGGSVTFSELSEGSAATSWQWSFPGGQPATSNSPNPTVVYPNAGNYSVSLVITNSAGSDSSYFQDFVRVRPYYTGHESSYNESFEGDLNSSGLIINSPFDNNTFQVTSAAATDGSKSLKLDNFTSGAYAPMTTIKGSGARDELITPLIFPTFAKNLVLNFDYAFAARQASSNYDALRVYASEDCGQTWSFIRVFQSGLLRTAPDKSGSGFTPTAAQWRSGLIPLAGYDGRGPILVKFEFENGGGNNFYIDNIQVTSDNVSITEYELAKNINVFPNPSTGQVNVTFTSATKSVVKVALYDLYGRLVISESLNPGTRNYAIGSDEKLASGVYLLQVEERGMTYAERLVVK